MQTTFLSRLQPLQNISLIPFETRKLCKNNVRMGTFFPIYPWPNHSKHALFSRSDREPAFITKGSIRITVNSRYRPRIGFNKTYSITLTVRVRSRPMSPLFRVTDRFCMLILYRSTYTCNVSAAFGPVVRDIPCTEAGVMSRTKRKHTRVEKRIRATVPSPRFVCGYKCVRCVYVPCTVRRP